MTPYPDAAALQVALLDMLAPITRWRIPPPSDSGHRNPDGSSGPLLVNPHGVDHHIDAAHAVRLDRDDLAHAYIVTYSDAGRSRRGRTTMAGSYLSWGLTTTIAGGDPTRARWALDQVRPLLDGAVLRDPAGRALTTPLLEYFEPGAIRPDEGTDPVRWFTVLRHTCTARRPR